ncbi:WD repeat-containing and planar cell polarity effector protein fritz homolog isoform X1 [Oryzias latipes]|uniref:WD repeat containing planar cell polarity effector n=1 Tax=Oryzias latipes TaxID=8090 RepID=A0A3B3H778_ORYLA|nr:WD repeat-containing and planar cell polarity effector protein fritz homolog isoform X1 [Oryzias latipes]XP_011482489.1 WD repeat-containing and planar cell polarity effector protein fritz homolog isoform X1 [Oryzias latipes]XP_020565008.1 WD repeat-containing and planar cell polarity effector protein fritz homolog isoform X1 [Oryzias latipes]
MAFCLAELHLWSTKNSLHVKDTDIGTYQYYEKGEPAAPPHLHYYDDKLQFALARGHPWTPRNRRPEKLHDSLKELEELLQTDTCIHTRWRNKQSCQLMLSSGVLVTMTLNGQQLEQLCVDRTLVSRLPASTVTDALLTDRLILLSFLEGSQAAAVFLNKKNQDSPEAGRRTDKLSPSEIKLVSVEVGGQKLHRRVALNRLQDVALCWWSQSAEDTWTSDVLRPNLVLICCSAPEGLQVLSSVQTEGLLLDCRFSQLQHYQVLTVEVPAGPQGLTDGFCVDSCMYECRRGRMHRLSATRIPLPSPPVSCSRHPSGTAVVLGLKDSNLVLYDHRQGVSLLGSCMFQPTLLAWHPAGAMVVVATEQQELMCFDAGLAPLKMALVAEDVTPAATLRLTQHMSCSGGLQGLQWAIGLDGDLGGADMLMLVFEGGPLATLKFKLGALTGGHLGPGELLQQRLRCSQVKEAVGILQAMDWSTMGDECYRGLSSVTNHLLKLQLSAEREALLEAALSVFYAPPAPLPDTVMLEYQEPVSKYARRFFHHLLRHQRFEKAFLLAVDLQDRGLFMDLHYVAGDKGEVVLADVAKRKAHEIEAAAVAGDEVILRSRSIPSGLSDGRTERNLTVTEPSSKPRIDGRTNQRRTLSEGLHMTISPDMLRTLKQTGSVGRHADGENEDEDPEMLHVVHLGMV